MVEMIAEPKLTQSQIESYETAKSQSGKELTEEKKEQIINRFIGRYGI